MRDRFKFRVWSKITNSFIKDFENPIGSDYQLVLTQDGYLCELGLGDYECNEETHSWGTLKPFSDVVIQQCTGLKDKNGNLIFEGDIVKINEYRNPVEVDFYGIGYRLIAKDREDFNFAYYENRSYIPKDVEVIGNIYENPELIKEQEQ